MSDQIGDYLASLRDELSGVPDAGDLIGEMEDHLREAVSLSHLCGLDLDGLTSILSMLYKEEDL